MIKQIKSRLETTEHPILRIVIWALAEIFCIFSLIYFVINENDISRIVLTLASIFIVNIPIFMMLVLHFEMKTWVYIICSIYTVCPLLGHGWKFYFLIPGYDKFLHTFGGFIFALMGAYIAVMLGAKSDKNVAMCVIFAICFSISLSVVWEFVEFSLDSFFGLDMQKDTVVNTIYSYFLSDDVGMRGSIKNISQVSVNGTPLGVNGYLDIGLIDTMLDVLVETLGAVIYAILHIFVKPIRTAFYPYGAKKSDSDE